MTIFASKYLRLATLGVSLGLLATSYSARADVNFPAKPVNLVTAFAAGSGPAGFEVNSFVSLVASKGMAPDLAAKINADVLKVLVDSEVKTRFNTFAFESLTWSPAEIRRNADLKSKTYEQLVKRKNISLD